MDNLKNNDDLQVLPVRHKCPDCGDETYQWQCISGDKTYTAPSIEAAIQQVPLIPTSDKTHLRICSQNACGETVLGISSNYPKGGDAGHGGSTTLCIETDSMNMSLDIYNNYEDICHFENCHFNLNVHGDEEFSALLNGLIAMVEALKRRKKMETVEKLRYAGLDPELVDKLPQDLLNILIVKKQNEGHNQNLRQNDLDCIFVDNVEVISND